MMMTVRVVARTLCKKISIGLVGRCILSVAAIAIAVVLQHREASLAVLIIVVSILLGSRSC